MPIQPLPLDDWLSRIARFSTKPGLMAARSDVPAAGAPATTLNAVEGVKTAQGSDQPAYPTQYRSGFDAGRAATPTVNAYPVGPVNRDITPYPGAVDMTNARMTAPGFNLPRFNAAPPAVAAGAAGIGGVGLLPPEFHSQINGLLDEARPLLSSGGIVDRLRGRQLMRARARLIEGATSIAGQRTAGINAETGQVNAGANVLASQTGAFRATNEVPLALLSAATHKYGYDVGARTAEMQDVTHRYTNDQNTSALRYGVDSRLLEALPKMQRDQLTNEAITGGDFDTAHRIESLGRQDLRPQPDSVTDVAGAGGVMIRSPGGASSFKTYAELQAEATKATAAATKKRLEDARAK